MGSVPFDPQLAADCDVGAAVRNDTPVGRALSKVAGRLRERLEETP